MTHKVILNGYSALLPGANKSPVIALGTAGSYGIEQLQLAPDARWQGLTITATFHPAAGDPVRVFAGPDNLLDVPPEATATAATKEKPGKIVFAGVSDGVQRISCDLPYIVDTHAAVEGQESSATPDVLAQAIAQTGAARDEAVQAAADANKAAGEAKEALAGIGDSVGRAEAAADRAEQAAANIESAASAVEAAKTDALTAIGNAKTEAVESVTAAGEKAVESVETVASESVESVNSAGQTALDAITSGKNTALSAVNLAQTNAVQAVNDSKSTGLNAIQSAQNIGVSAVQGAQSTAETAISEAETGALKNIATEKETSVKAVNDAGSTATGAIADAKSDALSKIETAKTGAVEAVTAEGDKQAERVQSIFPAVTEDDDGKVPIVQNGAWTLGEVAQDAYTRAESDARYAPIESAIRPTANGNPAVCEDSIAWGFQGLKVYGKSTQVSNQLLPLTQATYTGGGLTGTVQGDGSIIVNGTPESDVVNVFYIPLTLSPGTYYISGGEKVSGAVVAFVSVTSSSGTAYYANQSFTVSGNETSIVAMLQSADTQPINNYRVEAMLNAGSSPLPLQSCTPTPESPVPIVSAGEGGFITLSITDGAEQSQSFTLSTPSGLPGIPVDSGGNYTDSTGQQWICDAIDFRTGTIIQNCKETVLSSDMLWIKDGEFYIFTPDIEFAGDPSSSFSSSFCNYATHKYKDIIGATDKWEDGAYVYSGAGWFEVRFNGTIDEWKSYIDVANPPIRVLFALKAPIVTPLSAEEIAAYRALQTYAGTTVVSTAEPVAGIEARYVVNSEAWVKNEIKAAVSEAITAAVKLSGGNA